LNKTLAGAIDDMRSRDQSLRTKTHILQASEKTINRLLTVNAAQEQAHREQPSTSHELQQDVARLMRELETARHSLKHMEDAGTKTSNLLGEKARQLQQLQQQLADSKTGLARAQDE